MRLAKFMKAKDNYLIILDFLPHGKAGDRRTEPVAQGIGEKFLNLLEVAIKSDSKVKPKDRIYIGDERRDEVKYIRGRIKYDELTSYAKNTLEEVLENLVDANEKNLIEIFNKAGPITTRMHSLELLPGVGKKHLWSIINERKKNPFKDFKDLQKRVPMLPDPKRMMMKRIIEELQEKDKRRLIVGVKWD